MANRISNRNHPPSETPQRQLGQWLQQIGVLLVVVGFGILGWSWFTKNPEHTTAQSRTESYKASSIQNNESNQEKIENRDVCKVLSVYDGDTFACDLNQNGKIDKPKEQVRMVGIDTPEMHYSNKNKTGEDEPGAKAASEFTQQLLKGHKVFIERDLRPQDKYGRTLAYVYLENQSKSVNEQLLAKGLATHFFIPPNMRYESEFLEAETDAQNKQLGLWGSQP